MLWSVQRRNWRRAFAFLPAEAGGDVVWLGWYWKRPGGEGTEVWFDHWGPLPHPVA